VGKKFGVEVGTPRKSIITEPRHLTQKRWRYSHSQKCVLQSCARSQEKKYKKGKKNIWTWYFTAMPGQPFGADFHNFWRVGSYRRRNEARQISSRSVKGFGVYGYPKSGVSHWLLSSPLQQCYALPCYTDYRATLWL